MGVDSSEGCQKQFGEAGRKGEARSSSVHAGFWLEPPLAGRTEDLIGRLNYAMSLLSHCQKAFGRSLCLESMTLHDRLFGAREMTVAEMIKVPD